MPEPKRPLTPANQNPWDVLMTLYGEQDGEEVDWELHEKNRKAWNAWACQGMSEEERRAAADATGVKIDKFSLQQDKHDAFLQRFRNELQSRNKGDDHIWQQGLPHQDRTIEMSAINFEKTVNLQNLAFPTSILINDSIFQKSVNFNRSYFLSDAYFDSTYFKGATSLDDVTVLGDLWFQKSECELPFSFVSSKVDGLANFDEATFKHEAMFTNSQFAGDASFTGVNFFGRCSFRHATFNWQIFLSNTNFGVSAEFNSTKFKSLSNFSNSRMIGNVDFQFAIFEDRAYFTNTYFRTGDGNRPVRFSDCQFGKPTNFNAATFHSTYPDFSGTVLHDKTTFTDHPDHWPKGAQTDPEQAKASCAVIRHNLGRQGLPEAEHFFFRREMGFAGQIGKSWQRAPYLCFGLLSDYGYSIARPALWLLGLWGIGFMAFWGYFLTHTAQARPMGTAFALSFSNLFQVFGFSRLYFDADFMQGLPLVLQIYSGLQTVLAVPLLFFLALGLRTRFRMR